MEKTGPPNKSSFFFATHLVIYEITFALFVIYYIQQGTWWFRISWLAIAVSALTALIRMRSGYSKPNRLPGDHKKAPAMSLVGNLLFFALYIFCLLVQVDQWKAPGLPPLFIIPLLAAPPLIAFAAFLYSDARGPDISNEDQ